MLHLFCFLREFLSAKQEERFWTKICYQKYATKNLMHLRMTEFSKRNQNFLMKTILSSRGGVSEARELIKQKNTENRCEKLKFLVVFSGDSFGAAQTGSVVL